MDMPKPPQLAGVSPAAVYFSGGGGVCRPPCLMFPMLIDRRTSLQRL
jgi:hypothetical protein